MFICICVFVFLYLGIWFQCCLPDEGVTRRSAWRGVQFVYLCTCMFFCICVFVIQIQTLYLGIGFQCRLPDEGVTRRSALRPPFRTFCLQGHLNPLPTNTNEEKNTLYKVNQNPFPLPLPVCVHSIWDCWLALSLKLTLSKNINETTLSHSPCSLHSVACTAWWPQPAEQTYTPTRVCSGSHQTWYTGWFFPGKP